MEISRRRVLTALGLGTMWSAIAPWNPPGMPLQGAPAWAAPGRHPKGSLDLATATADTFRPHLGTRFRVRREGQRAEYLTLTDVVPQPPDGGPTDGFSLLFGMPEPSDLAQTTYGLEHGSLGSFSMFLVPVGSATVEAVVNHLAE